MVKYSEEELFAALGQSVRRRMVERLAREGRLSVSQMAKPFSISLPAALKHTEILAASGLIKRSKVGRVHYCSLNEQAFDWMLSWVFLQKHFWESSFERLEKHLINHKKK